MDSPDPSPRASKRRRTGTYATRKRTLASSPAEPAKESLTTSLGAEKAIQSPAAENDGDGDFRGPAVVSTETRCRESSKKRTAEDEIADIVASAQAAPRSKRSRKSGVVAKDTDGPVDIQNDAAETVQTRSVGRPRRSLHHSSPAVEPLGSKSKLPTSNTRTIVKTNETEARTQQTVSSPQPKGILTPSRHGRGQGTGSRKSVAFFDEVDVDDKDERQIEDHLGFKDIETSRKKQRNRTLQKHSESLQEEETEEVFEDATKFLQGQDMIEDEDDGEEGHDPALDVGLEAEKALPVSISNHENPDLTEDDPHLTAIKSHVLLRMTSHSENSSRSKIPSQLETQYATLHSLLNATVTAGESNSLLLLGSRGSGKSLLVEHALADLRRSHGEDFHVVRLNGFFQTDDKVALIETWRQLGREMAVPEDETGEVSSHADTMASLLSLLSHPEELGDPDATQPDPAPDGEHREGANRTSKSVIFVMDEFDLFTTHPRQTLLYNLFDIAQAKKAPIAVIGCSARMDVVDCLEKRVKSRFSHRWLHVPASKSLVGFEEAVRDILCLPVEGIEALGLPMEQLKWRGRWNELVKAQLLPHQSVQRMLKKVFFGSKTLPDVLSSMYAAVATLSLPTDNTNVFNGAVIPWITAMDMTTRPPSMLALIPHLPILHLSLLIAATRLETIHDVTMVHFTLVYRQYIELLNRSKLQRSSLSSFSKGGTLTGAGLRSWSKETARGAWEDLAQWELIVPAFGTRASGRLGDDLGGDGIVTKMFRVDVTLDEVAWAIKEKLGAVGAGEPLMKWCKEV